MSALEQLCELIEREQSVDYINTSSLMPIYISACEELHRVPMGAYSKQFNCWYDEFCGYCARTYGIARNFHNKRNILRDYYNEDHSVYVIADQYMQSFGYDPLFV